MMMETDENPVPPQNGDAGESQQPPRRRTRFQEAPDEAKSNLPPPGRVNAPGAPPSSLRPPSLMAPPGMRPPAPRPLMNFEENQPLNFFNAPPRNHNNMQRPNGGPRPRPGIGYQGGPPPRYPPRGFPPGMPGMPPGGMPFRPPQASPQDKLKTWLELAGVEDEIWVETKAGEKSYYYNAVTRQTVWQKPTSENVRIVDQAGLQALVDTGMKIERERNPQGAIPPLMSQPGFPGFPMPGAGMPPRMQMPTDPSAAWQEFTSPDGRKYYFNMITQENTWEKPKVLVDREANGGGAMAPPHAQPTMAPTAFAPTPVAVHSGAAAASQNNAPSGGGENRPVSSHPVSGTPWCIVWTGDGRVFFYNPTTKTSVWQRPPDLYNRPDVDLLVAKRPEEKENTGGTKSSPDGTPFGKTETPNQDGTDDEDDEEGDFKAPPKKRTRQEKKQDRIDEQKKAAQKEKKEKAKPVVKEIDPAIEAEIKAKQTRAEIPLEERQASFREMLVERGVSANSTFQKELSKIVFDSRYLLLSASERKIAFEEYAKERAEIEKAEKKAKAKVAKEKYMELLQEAKDLHGKSNFQKFVNVYGKDERFKAVERSRDREDFFNDYIAELYTKEKEEKNKQREESKAAFRELLESRDDIRRNSKWSHVKRKIDSDPRYKGKGLDSDMREEIFREYASTLPKAEESDEERHIKEKDEPKTAEEKAIERRKDEVESELSQQRKERNKEKEMLQYKEEVDHFHVVLKDLIRNADFSWHDARKILKKDNRYKKLELLSKDEKEDIFKEHIRELDRKRQETFFQLLNEQEGIDVNTRWKDAKKIIFDDEKYSKLIQSERRVENDFRDWRKCRLNELLKDFKELLRETKIITFESKNKILLNEGHLSDILAVLENDKRYLLLKDCPEDRERELERYIDDLDQKGPPPPPTQLESEQHK
uniref:Transcription elongation regulator 1 n=1 Tax=Panagrolaimus sp. PS1159 TaxID=55785 RepID=A0AC35G8B9_9BILA